MCVEAGGANSSARTRVSERTNVSEFVSECVSERE